MSGRGELVWHSDDLKRVTKGFPDHLDQLTEGRCPFVADVERLSRSLPGVVDPAHDRGSSVRRERSTAQGQATVGQNYLRTPVQRSPHEHPAEWSRVARSVNHRIAEMRGRWVMREHCVLRLNDVGQLAIRPVDA